MSANAPSSAHGGGPSGPLADAEREFQDHIFRIQKDGYTILRGVWPAERCAAARALSK